jgi:hypothetical protein
LYSSKCEIFAVILTSVYPVRNTKQRSVSFVLLTRFHSGDQVENTEMGRTYGTYGERKSAYRVLVGNLREEDHLEDLGADGRILLKVSLRGWVGGGQ